MMDIQEGVMHTAEGGDSEFIDIAVDQIWKKMQEDGRGAKQDAILATLIYTNLLNRCIGPSASIPDGHTLLTADTPRGTGGALRVEVTNIVRTPR